VIGRPAIWVPFAAALRDEQTANARQLVDAGAALMMTEAQFDVSTLTMALQNLLSDDAMAADMATKAVACSVPDATDRLVQLVENLAEARKR
jgi:UDP-N-acetylglucosamine--N-acetylmuramyl-(pentapeptide) pyrophosphoryl-undecaprenol N-acetylglucosamine transferase